MSAIKLNTELRNNELLLGKLQLYSLIEEGLNQVEQGRVKPMRETIKSIRAKIAQ
jgi:hypothetical protein